MSGIADAASAPKTKAKSTKVSGIEIPSANFKSSAIFSLMALPTTPTPPAYKVKPATLPSYLV